MRYLLSVYKRMNGKVEQWNLARDTDLPMSAAVEKAFLEDEAARLREKWRVDEFCLRIRQHREIAEFKKMQNVN